MKIANNLNNTYAFCFILICSNQTTIGVDGRGEGGGGGVDWGKRDQESFARSSSDLFSLQFLLITTQKNWDSISEILRNDVK